MAFLKYFLYPFSILYNGITTLRNWLYDTKRFRSAQFNIPTINVGNLNTGGSGKTPHIEYLIELLKDEYLVATLSRGYGRKTKGFIIADELSSADNIGDEPAQIKAKYKDIIVSVGENRLLAVPQLLQAHPDIDVLLLDDAFQHRSVQPGLNILLTTYDNPYFNDHVLPMGRLRENISGRKRADIIIMTKCPADLSAEERASLITQLKPFPYQKVFFSSIQYKGCYNYLSPQEIVPLTKEIEYTVLTGIAHPQYLHQYLKNEGIAFNTIIYNDHYNYKNADIQTIINNVSNISTKHLITTEKDFVRLSPFIEMFRNAGITILIMSIKMQIIHEEELFRQHILTYTAQQLKESENLIQRI